MRFDEYYLTESVIDNPSFKSWFAGSKVVDEQGNPKVTYHGTMGDFDKFDYKHLGSQGRAKGAGFYFTDIEGLAKGYAQTRDKQGKVLKAYLRIRKPLDVDASNFDRSAIEKIVKKIADAESKENGMEIEDGFLSNWGDARHEGLDNVIDSAVEAYSNEDKAIDFQGSLIGENINPRIVNNAIYDVTGYDGIIESGTDGGKPFNIYIPFFPNQIKAVDNKTFNLQSDNIYK